MGSLYITNTASPNGLPSTSPDYTLIAAAGVNRDRFRGRCSI
jgi:hypothetical protein